MKKNKLLAGALALAVAAVSIFSPLNVSEVKAAKGTDKETISLDMSGDYTVKKISDADAKALKKAFLYDEAATRIYVCGENASGYINFENSAVDFWKVYRTEILKPSLSRDASGNLVVDVNQSTNLGDARWIGAPNGSFAVGEPNTFSILDKEVSTGETSYYMNHHLGKVYADYGQKDKDKVTDAYVIRIYYTTDKKGNYTAAESGCWIGPYDEQSDFNDWMAGTVDANTAKLKTDDEKEAYYTPVNRNFGYTDIWILPKGAKTVLNLEDATKNTKTSNAAATSLPRNRVFITEKYVFSITGKNTVTFECANSGYIDNKKLTVPDKVTCSGKTYKVTSVGLSVFSYGMTSITIGKNVKKINAKAFAGCSNLKTITIKSTNLKAVGKNALEGIHASAKIKVPKSKLSAYKKLFAGKGQGKNVKIVGY